MKIVCFGDSVTRGITNVQGRLRIIKANYPSLLQTLLKRDQPIEVVNKGTFNDNSDKLLERVDTDVLSLHPDYVLVLIGGNDCDFNWEAVAAQPNAVHEPVVPIQRYLDNLRSLTARIRAADSVPVLMNLIPLDPVRYYKRLIASYGEGIAHWIARCGGIEHWHGLYNRQLCQWMRERSDITVDLRSAFKKAADLSVLLSDDGIHPTATGYQVISETIAAEFGRLWKANGSCSISTGVLSQRG